MEVIKLKKSEYFSIIFYFIIKIIPVTFLLSVIFYLIKPVLVLGIREEILINLFLIFLSLVLTFFFIKSLILRIVAKLKTGIYLEGYNVSVNDYIILKSKLIPILNSFSVKDIKEIYKIEYTTHDFDSSINFYSIYLDEADKRKYRYITLNSFIFGFIFDFVEFIFRNTTNINLFNEDGILLKIELENSSVIINTAISSIGKGMINDLLSGFKKLRPELKIYVEDFSL